MRVSDNMEITIWNVQLSHEAFPAMLDIARRDRLIRSCSEYQSIEGLYFSILLDGQNSAHRFRRDSNDALSCSGFRRIDDNPAFRLLQIIRDMNFTFTGINIAPSKGEDFAKSHPGSDGHEEKNVIPPLGEALGGV